MKKYIKKFNELIIFLGNWLNRKGFHLTEDEKYRIKRDVEESYLRYRKYLDKKDKNKE